MSKLFPHNKRVTNDRENECGKVGVQQVQKMGIVGETMTRWRAWSQGGKLLVN